VIACVVEYAGRTGADFCSCRAPYADTAARSGRWVLSPPDARHPHAV